MGSTPGTFQNRNPSGDDITHYCHLVAVIVDSGACYTPTPDAIKIKESLWTIPVSTALYKIIQLGECRIKTHELYLYLNVYKYTKSH